MSKHKTITASEVDCGQLIKLGAHKYRIDLTGTLGNGKRIIGAVPLEGDVWDYIIMHMEMLAKIDIYKK